MKQVCIVGYGAIGPVHAAALENVANANLYALCDIDPDKRKRCTEKYSVVEYADFDKMLEDNNIDTVHICTPHYLHFPMIKKALAAGKDVVVEKPLTMTKEEFIALQKLDGADRVCVVLQNRLNPGIVRLKELIDNHELGEVKAAKAMLTWHRDQAYYESADWRGKWATEGGGLMINQAIHTLDFFSYLLGNVKNVKAQMCNYTLDGIIEVEDTCSAVLEMESGVRGVFFATNGYPENSNPLFEVTFEKGIARYIDKQLWINGQLVVKDSEDFAGKAYWGNGHAGLLKRYYDDHEYFTVTDAANTMETLFGMYESAGFQSHQ